MSIVSRRFAWLALVPLFFIADLGVTSTQIVRGRPAPARTPVEMLIAFAVMTVALLAIGIPIARRKLAPRPRTAYVVSWAICVGVAGYGVTAAMLTTDPRWFAPFGAAALVGLALTRPRVAA